MIVNQKIIATGTSGVTTYGTPSTFISNLENYLKVRSVFPDGLSMISVGINAPSQAYQNVPWLELDANNNPTALKYFNGARWINIAPSNAITSQNTNVVQLFGQAEFTVEKAQHNTTLTTNAFTLPQTFNSNVTPLIMITPVECTLQKELDENPNVKFNYYVSTVERTNFKINYSYSAEKLVTDVAVPDGTNPVQGEDLATEQNDPFAADATSLSFKFNYIALGQI